MALPETNFILGKYNRIQILVYSARNLEDTKCHHHVKTYKISLKEGCFAEDSLSHINLDYGSHSLIPVLPPLCGLLIIGGKEVTYCNADVLETILIEDSNTIAYGMKEKVTGLQIKHLGDTSIAYSISCVDQGTVYIGSKYGDSQLIKLDLKAESRECKSFEIVCQFGANYGLLYDSPQNEWSRSAGVDEQMLNEDEKGIKGTWSIKASDDRVYLILSYVQASSSFVLKPNGEMDEKKMEGLYYEAQSLFCHEAIHNQLLQVTSES
ncbi:unnamed protein product [Vicia faba]|uniref:RSE1/DDB1/CPSF1 first beta-propeller domain-containing protein n=1 Tax=Vicia faba TaxID=3906 RepID=A0AAV0ZU82_VICFA|nr:unnamed protein product [Vicia faba]